MREHGTIIFGMTAGDLMKLAGAIQLLATVEARGIEQTVTWDLAVKIGGNQRFGNEAPDVIDGLGRCNIGYDGNRGFQREIACEHGKATQHCSLCSASS
jgi:hypothetical protein